MSIATTSLKYGWKVLAILTIGAGSIFVADNVLNRITTKDRIEITLAVVERCLATQTGTNPATYGVDPLSIVRTWTDTNGASVTMTNALEWRDDLSMKVELDAKLEALCPYYVDPDSVYDGTTNIVMHTFTGLLTSLDLGDHTNFTAIPAIGTNAATYGPWAWRNYIVAWQERYKVLEALKITRDYRTASINGSKTEDNGSWLYDLVEYYYSNKVSGVVQEAYLPYWEAYALGISNAYYFEGNTNYVDLPLEDARKMSYSETKIVSSWSYINAGYLNYPPWTAYTNGYLEATNKTGLGVGEYMGVTKEPFQWYDDYGPVYRWYWVFYSKLYYATWKFDARYPDQQVTNTAAIYLKPTLPSLSTEITTNNNWDFPQSWLVSEDPTFEELVGMPTNVYSKLDSGFIVTNGDEMVVEFGSDQFAPMREAASENPWPIAPTEGASAYDNSGSVGTLRGSYVGPDDYFFVKTWQFLYATNKYW